MVHANPVVPLAGQCRTLVRLLNRPRGDQLVDLPHEAHGLPEGHHDLAVVGHVVVGESASGVVRLDGPVQIGGSVPESAAGHLQYQLGQLLAVRTRPGNLRTSLRQQRQCSIIPRVHQGLLVLLGLLDIGWVGHPPKDEMNRKAGISADEAEETGQFPKVRV